MGHIIVEYKNISLVHVGFQQLTYLTQERPHKIHRYTFHNNCFGVISRTEKKKR